MIGAWMEVRKYEQLGITTQWPEPRENFHRDLCRYARMHPATSAFSAMWFSGVKNYEKRQIRIAYLGEILAGFSVVHERVRPPQCATLHFLFVHPSCQRRGVARVLLAEAEERTAHPVMALNVLEDNEPAIQLYQSLGYKVVCSALDGKGFRMEKKLTK